MAEIGRDSYAQGTRQAVGAASVSSATQAQVGTIGQGAFNQSSIPGITSSQGDGGAANIEMLFAIGGNLLKPHLEKAQQARFDEGMRRAAAGEAAKDIEAERPAWAGLFGEGDVTLGARTYEGAADAAKFESSVLTAMHELRKLPAAAVQARIREIGQSFSTGDPTRDAALQRSVLGAMPGLLKMHAKEGWAWQQAEGLRAYGDYVSTTSVSLEGYMRDNPTATPEDRKRYEDKFRETWVPANGQNLDTATETQAINLMAQMSAGNFASANVFRKTVVDPEKGTTAWDLLPAKHRDRLQSLYQHQGKVELQRRMTGTDTDYIAAIYNETDPAKVDIRTAEFNAQLKARTEIDVDYLGADFNLNQKLRIEQLARHNAGLGAAAAKRAQTELDKEAATQANVDAAAIALGNVDPASSHTVEMMSKISGGWKSEEVYSGMLKAWRNPDPKFLANGNTLADWQAVVTRNSPGNNHPGVDSIMTAAFNGGYNGSVIAAKNLLDSKFMPRELRQKVAGSPQRLQQFEDFSVNLASQMDPKLAWETAEATAATKAGILGTGLSKDEKASIVSAVNKYTTEGMFIATDTATNGGKALLGMLAANSYGSPSNFTANEDPARAAVVAGVSRARNAGGMWWLPYNPNDPAPWQGMTQGTGKVPVTQAGFAKAAMAAMSKKAEDAGLGGFMGTDADDLIIVRPSDVGGRWQFVSTVTNKGRGPEVGAVKTLTIRQEDVQPFLDKAYTEAFPKQSPVQDRLDKLIPDMPGSENFTQ